MDEKKESVKLMLRCPHCDEESVITPEMLGQMIRHLFRDVMAAGNLSELDRGLAEVSRRYKEIML